jgi:glycosidase
LSFADNHDVSRVYSILNDKKHIKPIYGLVFGMPGVPSVYYGSEWGMEGDKSWGDESLRPALAKPEWNGLTDFIAELAKAKTGSKALNYGSYRNIVIQPKQLIFERSFEGERVLVAINADSNEYTAHFDAGCGRATDLITGELHDFGGGSLMEPYSVHFWRCE